jgi:putative hydrolase of the HAD superfamily
MITTILFDFDDTVCNTTQCVEEGLTHCYKKLTEFFPHITHEEFVKADIDSFRELFYHDRIPVYRASTVIWFRIFKKLKLDEDPVLIYKMYKHMYNYVEKHIQPTAGLYDLLRFAKANKMKVGILSNGAFLEKMERYNRLKLSKYKVRLITSDVIGYEKPDPRAFRKILKITRSKPNQSIFIGDTPSTDISGASRIGITPILFRRESKSYTPQDLSCTSYVISSHKEVIKIIEELNKDI